ncbi:MAG: HAD family phosphatase [Anaerolineaceae bacterium]|jgi:2-haloacid dehalogenase|nr:HAD family phosphatase [Anaerolineaceae bacterium]
MDKTRQPAIIFDLGGVLIDWQREHLYKKMFAGDQAGMQYFLDEVCSLEWNAQMDCGYPFARAIEERVALFPEYEDYIRAYWTRWEEMVPGQISGTVDILAALRQQGYPLAVLSNWSAETHARVYRKFEFLHWFDEVVISGREKLIKPDPAIFHLLLDRLGRPAEECLFIDDSETNVRAAGELGIETVLFTSSEQLCTELRKRGII